jgi:broad specificity phosphatase PhoE
MTTRVLLLRHAESANPAIFHGAESDVGLSERGRRQAEAVAGVVAASRPQLLVSSTMRRALDTTAPIAAACGLAVQVEPDLHERRVGALTGTPTGLHEGVWPDTLKRWLAGDTGYAPDGAESFDNIRKRVLPVWERVTAAAEGQTLVIVAHGVVCRVLLLSVLPGHTIADWPRLGPMRNVGINELVREQGVWRAVRLNEVPAEVVAADGSPQGFLLASDPASSQNKGNAGPRG